MIRVTVLYPSAPGTHFDVDYYLNRHMPRAIELLGPTLRAVSVDIGIGGAVPGEPAPYAALCNFSFDTLDAFLAAFLPHAPELQGDIPNYTNAQSVIQVSEIRISQ